MSRRPPSAKPVVTRGKENSRGSHARDIFSDLAAVPTSRANLLQLISDPNNKPLTSELQSRRLCGWQEDVLQRIDTNKSYKRRNYKKTQVLTQEDHQRNLYLLKKEAEFLESDNQDLFDAADQPTVNQRKKIKFPTESDITNLMARETCYLSSKNSLMELQGKPQQFEQPDIKKVAMNSSSHLSEFMKKVPHSHINGSLQICIRQRPSTSAPNCYEPLFVRSVQATIQEPQIFQPSFQPIHTAVKMRRRRRKVKSVTEPTVTVGPPAAHQPTAGLIGNASLLQKSEYCSSTHGAVLPHGSLVFQKYNRMVRGKKLRSHRISTVAS